jgi:TolA-binding protein
MEKHDRVTYNSTGRPWLRGRIGRIDQFNFSGTSALVVFEKDNQHAESAEWIGLGALEKVTSNLSETRQKVQDEITKLEKQISDLRSRVSKLNQANKALKDLGL